MLQRNTSTSALWPGRSAGWQRDLQAGLDSILVRYLLLLAAICALGCIYLWQANGLSELHGKIAVLERQAAELERENIRLAQQSARWNAPDYVERRMQEEGFVDAQSVVFTRLPAAPDGSAELVAQSPGSP